MLASGMVSGMAAAAPPATGDAAVLRSLAAWTGWTPQRLEELRAAAGEDDAEDFAVALVVALNLGVNARALAEGGRRGGLVATLRDMGISADTARREVRRAEQTVRGWRRQPAADGPAAGPSAASTEVPPAG
jgi:hypothetical protein